MPLTVNERKASFTLKGPDCEPDHWAWEFASPAERIAYFKRLGEHCVRELRTQLRLGRDAKGKPFAPLRNPRPDGATGKPLVPHHAESRFSKYLSVFAAVDRTTIYWGRGWAKFVRWHREGAGRLPPRDAVGLSPHRYRKVVAEARAVWARLNGLRGVRGRGLGVGQDKRRKPRPQPRPSAYFPSPNP